MTVKTIPLAALARGLWLAYLCGALWWLYGSGAADWRFWAVCLGAATLQPVCSALGSALNGRRDPGADAAVYVAGADVLAGGVGAEKFAWKALEGRLLPASYARATWRCTLPIDAQDRLGLGFNLETGEVVRLSLDHEGARHLAETVALFLRGHELRPEDDGAGPSQPLENRG